MKFCDMWKGFLLNYITSLYILGQCNLIRLWLNLTNKIARLADTEKHVKQN